MNKYSEKSIILFDLLMFSGRLKELLTLLTAQLDSTDNRAKQVLTIVTPNPEQVVLTRNSPEFLHALQAADVRIPDGIGLVYASKMVSICRGMTALPERLPGKAVVMELLSMALERGLTVLVIGGRALGERTAVADVTPAVQRLKPINGTAAKHLTSASWYWLEGYQDASNPDRAEETALITTLQQLRPELVFVAFGAPQQELWLESHCEELTECGVRIAMVVGGSFDVLTGKLKQSPRWMEKAGLEWAFRLWQEPHRWKRQLDLLRFIGLVTTALLKK